MKSKSDELISGSLMTSVVSACCAMAWPEMASIRVQNASRATLLLRMTLSSVSRVPRQLGAVSHFEQGLGFVRGGMISHDDRPIGACPQQPVTHAGDRDKA